MSGPWEGGDGAGEENGLPSKLGFFAVVYYPLTGDNVFIDQTLLGALHAIGRNGNDLVVRYGIGAVEEGDATMRPLVEQDLAGALIISPHVRDEKIGFLKRLGIPVVFIYFQAEDSWFGSVDMDNRKGAVLAVEHLIGLGHRRIAYLGGDLEFSSNARDRYQGFRDALNAAGIVENPEWVRHGQFEKPFGFSAMKSILELPASRRPTAVFAATDIIAMGAIQAAEAAGVRVPWDLSVVGFDDVELAQTCDPPLTTVHQPFVEIGQRAVELLRELIRHPAASDRRRLITPSLVVRSSAVAPQRRPSGDKEA